MKQQQRRAATSDDRVLTQSKRTVSMKRLVKVSVNPGGRVGAPETEPGPSGVGKAGRR